MRGSFQDHASSSSHSGGIVAIRMIRCDVMRTEWSAVAGLQWRMECRTEGTPWAVRKIPISPREAYRKISHVSATIPKTMRAVVYRGVNDLRVEEIPVPRIRSSELLVRVGVCGVCPTDIKKIHFGTQSPPRIYGHETAGTIVQVGSRVQGWSVGDRVGLHHHVPCLDCHFCRHKTFAQCETYKKTGITAGFEPAGGGYAEYVRVMDFCLPGVVKIPAKNTLEEGAMLEPVNTVLKGIRGLSLLKGDTVWVAGAGPIGLLFVGMLSGLGMRVVATDLMESRRQLARRWGAWRALDGADQNLVDSLRALTRGRGVDAAVVCVPVDAVAAQAQAALRGGGTTLLFAHTLRGKTAPVDLGTVCVDEKGLMGSYSSDFTLQKEVARWVFSRRVDVRNLITHRFPLAETAAAVALAARPSEDSLKILVEAGTTPIAGGTSL
jgi:L-iditol 2-dehydrogenase